MRRRLAPSLGGPAILGETMVRCLSTSLAKPMEQLYPRHPRHELILAYRALFASHIVLVHG